MAARKDTARDISAEAQSLLMLAKARRAARLAHGMPTPRRESRGSKCPLPWERKAARVTIELDALALSRLAACYGLLVRAAFDIGIKAEGSSKLSRALEDVAQARDTLASILGPTIDMPLTRKDTAALGAISSIRAMVFSAQADASRLWEFMRKREQEKRRDGEV